MKKNKKGSYIKIKLEAYDYKVLDLASLEIINTVTRTGAQTVGPIPLPVKLNKITVNRSPHIDKKSRDQFEISTHRRILGIIEPTPQTLDALMGLELSAGVNVEIEI